MRSKQPIRLYLILSILFLGMIGMKLRLLILGRSDRAVTAGLRQGQYHLHVPLTTGVIYDRYGLPLTQSEDTLIAAVNPTPETTAEILPMLADKSAFRAAGISRGPVLCRLTAMPLASDHVIVMHGRTNAVGLLPAQHLLGYRQEQTGVCGLEAACADILSKYDTAADLIFSVNGRGGVLPGADSSAVTVGQAGGGIVTTLDKRVQRIAETALQSIQPKSGAAVVLDCRNGDILASASLPVYRPDSLADALNDPMSPFLNRALCAYNVGSVFKLVSAAAALDQGLGGFCYECSGSIDVYGQVFRCHHNAGHGLLTLSDALTVSCNPYFISLTQLLTPDALHHTAQMLGFGQPITLAGGLSADAGFLQSADMLKIPAEKANFAFGQGKLLATPLHIAAMTAAIANGGIYYSPRLLIGETPDGVTVPNALQSAEHRALTAETALTLRGLMSDVLTNAEGSNAIPNNTTAGGKTSTAQTGRYDAAGNELCHAWMTGFFPADDPRYAVTVLVEDGGAGNSAAAPVFRRLIEEMVRCGL